MKKIFNLIIVLIALMTVSCSVNTNLSQKEPFKEAIGKRFILQRDFYIYGFNDGSTLFRIGDITNISNPSIGLPQAIEEKYIGVKGTYITIKGIAKKGSIFVVKSVVRNQTFENETYKYYISLIDNAISSKEEVDTYDITNIYYNPPDSPTWSDPPIFESKYALPLESDGIWWK